MLTITKRGRIYHLAGRIGGRRLRFTLGTGSRDAAEKIRNWIEKAIIEGKDSHVWPELARTLPPRSLRHAAGVVGYSERPAPELPTWDMLLVAFTAEMDRRVARGKLQPSTRSRYLATTREFSLFLAFKPGRSRNLVDINRPAIEEFKAWRIPRIVAKRQSRGGTGLDLDLAILHRVFAYGLECEMLVRNPVSLGDKPGGNAERGAQPYSALELSELRKAAGDDLLAFLVLRHTGMRGGDAVDLRWHEIEHQDDWKAGGLNRVTQKRRKRVWFALHPELLFALEAEYQRQRPQTSARVLLNPSTGKPLSRPRLYERMKALGRRAGVSNVHPHRFRDTFAVDLLLKGAKTFEVAKYLGDTVETVEKYYASWVKEFRDRSKRIIEEGSGLETMDTCWTQQDDAKPSTN
jgi:integrase